MVDVGSPFQIPRIELVIPGVLGYQEAHDGVTVHVDLAIAVHKHRDLVLGV